MAGRRDRGVATASSELTLAALTIVLQLWMERLFRGRRELLVELDAVRHASNDRWRLIREAGLGGQRWVIVDLLRPALDLLIPPAAPLPFLRALVPASDLEGVARDDALVTALSLARYHLGLEHSRLLRVFLAAVSNARFWD